MTAPRGVLPNARAPEIESSCHLAHHHRAHARFRHASYPVLPCFSVSVCLCVAVASHCVVCREHERGAVTAVRAGVLAGWVVVCLLLCCACVCHFLFTYDVCLSELISANSRSQRTPRRRSAHIAAKVQHKFGTSASVWLWCNWSPCTALLPQPRWFITQVQCPIGHYKCRLCLGFRRVSWRF